MEISRLCKYVSAFVFFIVLIACSDKVTYSVNKNDHYLFTKDIQNKLYIPLAPTSRTTHVIQTLLDEILDEEIDLSVPYCQLFITENQNEVNRIEGYFPGRSFSNSTSMDIVAFCDTTHYKASGLDLQNYISKCSFIFERIVFKAMERNISTSRIDIPIGSTQQRELSDLFHNNSKDIPVCIITLEEPKKPAYWYNTRFSPSKGRMSR